MTLCPVAIAAGCKKCPIFKVCPLKSVIGDQKPDDTVPAKTAGATAASASAAKATKPARASKAGRTAKKRGGRSR